MSDTAATIEPAALAAARQLVAIARARYPVVEAWLYGSHARGEAREDSDVDVAIVMNAPREEARWAGHELAGDAFDVLLETGTFTSPRGFSLTDWHAPDGFSNPRLLANIRRDGVPL